MKKIFRNLSTLLLLAGCPGWSSASERHFIYNYESSVLQEGGREFETYTTFRFGRDLFYSALDQRLEFEMGLGGGVQTSLYLNFTQEMMDGGGGNITNSFMADGISNEWKVKLKDSLTDDFGLGLYAEAEFKPDELELETKLILDKRFGLWLATFNMTYEPEYHLVDNTSAYSLIPSMGFGCYLVPERLFMGLEAQADNFYDDSSSSWIRSIFSAGPVISYTPEDWWITLTALPQLINWKGSSLDLNTSQKWQVRLAASFPLGSHPPSNPTLLPDPSEKDADRLAQTQGMVKLDDLKKGRDMYLYHCAACHQIHAPSEFSMEGWDKILGRMQVKSAIDDPTKESIFRYLSAFAKDWEKKDP